MGTWLRINISDLFIGCIVAFLPLYIRFSSVNLDQVSKSNALFCLIPAFVLLFTKKVKQFPLVLRVIFSLAIAHLIIFQYEAASFVGIYQSIGISLGLLFVFKYFETSNDQSDLILNFMVIGALAQCLISFSQFLYWDVYSNIIHYIDSTVRNVSVEGDVNYYGSLLNSNLFGAYLAFCLPAFFRPKLVYLAAPVIVFIVASKSIMAIAAMLASIYYFMFVKNKKLELFSYILAVIGFVSVCYFFEDLTSNRVFVWGKIFSQIDFSHFFLGNSPSWFESLKIHFGRSFVMNEHSDFFTIFNIFGIFGLVASAYIIHLIIKNRAKNQNFAAIFFASFVNMLGAFPLHVAPLALIVMVAAAHCIKGNYVSNMDW